MMTEGVFRTAVGELPRHESDVTGHFEGIKSLTRVLHATAATWLARGR